MFRWERPNVNMKNINVFCRSRRQHGFAKSNTFTLSSSYCLKWKKACNGGNILTTLGSNIYFAVWFERGMFFLCVERFVKVILNDIQAIFTQPYNELVFFCFVSVWGQITECIYSWNSFCSTKTFSFLFTMLKPNITYAVNVSFHLWVKSHVVKKHILLNL